MKYEEILKLKMLGATIAAVHDLDLDFTLSGKSFGIFLLYTCEAKY